MAVLATAAVEHTSSHGLLVVAALLGIAAVIVLITVVKGDCSGPRPRVVIR
jgi:hypothetical protein